MIQTHFGIFFFKSQSLEKSVCNMEKKKRYQKRNPKETKVVQKTIEISKNNSEAAGMEDTAKVISQGRKNKGGNK